MDKTTPTTEIDDTTVIDTDQTPNRVVTTLKRAGSFIKKNALKIALVGGASTLLAVVSFKNGQASMLNDSDMYELEYDPNESDTDDEDTIVLELEPLDN